MMEAATVTIYSAARAARNPAFYFWHALRACRSVAWRLFFRNLRAQYRRSFLRYGWLLLPPIAMTLTCVFLSRTCIMAVGATTLPFPLYVLAGTMLAPLAAEGVDVAPLARMASAILKRDVFRSDRREQARLP